VSACAFACSGAPEETTARAQGAATTVSAPIAANVMCAEYKEMPPGTCVYQPSTDIAYRSFGQIIDEGNGTWEVDASCKQTVNVDFENSRAGVSCEDGWTIEKGADSTDLCEIVGDITWRQHYVGFDTRDEVIAAIAIDGPNHCADLASRGYTPDASLLRGAYCSKETCE
jgi:hypothetical protein